MGCHGADLAGSMPVATQRICCCIWSAMLLAGPLAYAVDSAGTHTRMTLAFMAPKRLVPQPLSLKGWTGH